MSNENNVMPAHYDCDYIVVDEEDKKTMVDVLIQSIAQSYKETT